MDFRRAGLVMFFIFSVGAFSADQIKVSDQDLFLAANLYLECRALGDDIASGVRDELTQAVYEDISSQLQDMVEKFSTESGREEFCLQIEKYALSADFQKRRAVLPKVADADIIFHQSQSAQSPLIAKLTNSKYTHTGIIIHTSGKPFVFEASSTVKFSALSDFIARGVNGHYVIKRLIKTVYGLSDAEKKKMQQEALKFKGKSYDSLFLWSDSKIYCSELVWKIYERGAGLEIGGLEKFKNFDMSDPKVKAEIIRRFGSWEKVPMQETVISPVGVMKSWKLYTCASN